MKRLLAGRHIVITRPPAQAEGLATGIREAGGTPVLFPVLEIVASDPGPLAALAAHLGEFDLVFFVSPNAVSLGLPPLLAGGAWPARTCRARTASSMAGISIRTGQISRQAPHRVLALASSLNAAPNRAGETMDPSGPLYTAP